MDDLELLIDLHVGNHRQAPGSDRETRRALRLAGIDPNASLAVADMGCGTGASTIVLAQELDAHVLAIDLAPAFIDRLAERARRAGVDEKITPHVASMGDPPIAPGSLDLIWSEGAIYNIGFEAGLRSWKRLLRPGGVLIVSELCWTTATRPDAAQAHWSREYPGITTPSENLRMVENAGYMPIAMSALPWECWEAEYFTPLESVFDDFLERHNGSEPAREVVRSHQAEIRACRANARWFGYSFFVAKKPSDEPDRGD